MVNFDNVSYAQLQAIGTEDFDYERAVSGRSLASGVRESEKLPVVAEERRDWPYSFSEYLRRLIGSMVRVEYVYPNGQRTAAMGRLKIVGTDFVGLSPTQNGEQVLIGFGTIASIKVLRGK